MESMARLLRDAAYVNAVPMFGRCSQCGGLFSTSEEALTNTEQATRAFYLAFEGHNCDEDAGFQPAEPS
jgi:hypothetical protein